MERQKQRKRPRALERSTMPQLKRWLTVEEALIANPEELTWRGDALRVRGGLRLTLGHKDAAEADIHEAIVLAQKTNAKA